MPKRVTHAPIVPIQGAAAQELVGFPAEHCDGFCDIARDQKSVIISRAVGSACTTLLEEGHATKGFRIHGKSCDWGPMAGFVCRDPRLNKYGLEKAKYNREQHKKALYDDTSDWHAGTCPIRISGNRLKWLIRNDYLLGIAKKKEVFGTEVWEGVARHRAGAGIVVPYVLIKHDPPLGQGEFGLYAKPSPAFRQELAEGEDAPFMLGCQAILGMTNPDPEHPKSGPTAHKNVVTGDYDLFATWPRATDYEHEGMDRRLVGRGSTQDDVQSQAIINFEHSKIGNISDRVYLIAQLLNSIIGAKSGYPNRNVCHHSDEFGRPFVGDIDLPLIAFVPSLEGTAVTTCGINDTSSFRSLVQECAARGFEVLLHPAWAAELGGFERLVREWEGALGAEADPYRSWS